MTHGDVVVTYRGERFTLKDVDMRLILLPSGRPESMRVRGNIATVEEVDDAE